MTAGTALAVAATTPAMAGNDGQHIQVNNVSSANYIQVCGNNQSGHWKCTSVQHDPYGEPGYFSKWWFKGELNVWGWTTYGAGKTANYGVKSDCWASTVNPNGSNWSSCWLYKD